MFSFESILSSLTEINQQRLRSLTGMAGTQDLLAWGVYCYHGLPTSGLMEERGPALEFCCPLWSLQQIAIFAGCKTITSAVLVHCLRQKTEDELLEITQKMVSAPTLLDKQAPLPGNMAPGFLIPALPLPWTNCLREFLTSQEQCQPLDLNGEFPSFLF